MPELNDTLFQRDSAVKDTDNVSYTIASAMTEPKEEPKTMPEWFLPDWTDSVQMAQLSQFHPDVYTIRRIEKKEPEQYKIQFQYTGTDWIFWFLVVSLAILSWLRISFGKIISITLEAGVSYQAASRILRERNSVSLRVSLALNLLFAFNAGIFLYQICAFHGFIPSEIAGYWVTLLAFVGISVLYLVKEFLLRLLGFVAGIANPISEYINVVSINNKVLGMVIFPVIVCVQYAKTEVFPKEWMLYLGIGIFGIFYLVRIIRGIIISLRHSISFFYAFLYLCTLEIAPMLVVYTIIKSL